MSDSKKTSLADVPPAAGGAGSSRKVIITTLETVINSREAIMRLSQQPVSLRTAQKFLKLKKVIDSIGIAFGEKRDALAAEMGTPSGPNKWKLEPEQMEAFQEAITKMVKEEVQVPQDVCITLGDLNEAKISAEDLERVGYVIEDLE